MPEKRQNYAREKTEGLPHETKAASARERRSDRILSGRR
jgi:hypothetical protein